MTLEAKFIKVDFIFLKAKIDDIMRRKQLILNRYKKCSLKLKCHNNHSYNTTWQLILFIIFNFMFMFNLYCSFYINKLCYFYSNNYFYY